MGGVDCSPSALLCVSVPLEFIVSVRTSTRDRIDKGTSCTRFLSRSGTLAIPPFQRRGPSLPTDSLSLNGPSPPPLGFPQPPSGPRGVPTNRPRPLPRRPKGRWFVGLLLLGVCAFAGYHVWDTFFRFHAHGVINGRVLAISPPWDGMVTAFHVQEGERVRQGQLLAIVANEELRQRLAQLGDEVQLARANLEAETARLRWQLAWNLDQNRGAETMYYEAWGQLLQESARLEDLRNNHLERGRQLDLTRAISREELDQIKYSIEGLEQKIARSKDALAELKRRAERTGNLLSDSSLTENGAVQLRPHLVRIETLLAEQARLRERLEKGQVRSPINGLVLKRHRFTGERSQTTGPLLTILEEGSLEVVLYLPQSSSEHWAINDELAVLVEPHPRAMVCRLVRLGDQFEPAPEAIRRNYAEGQKLLPAHLEPGEELQHSLGLRVGGVVRLPASVPNFWRGGGR